MQKPLNHPDDPGGGGDHCEGRSDQVVSIERQADGDLLATWHDASVPVVMRYTPRMRQNWLTFRRRPIR